MTVTDRSVPVRRTADRRRAGRPPGRVGTVSGYGLGAVVTMTGRADPLAVAALSDSLEQLIADGQRHVVVDLAGVHDVDRRLLTLLARTRAVLATRFAVEGTLRVVGVVLPQFYGAMRDASPDEVFVVYDAVRRARARSPSAVRTASS